VTPRSAAPAPRPEISPALLAKLQAGGGSRSASAPPVRPPPPPAPFQLSNGGLSERRPVGYPSSPRTGAAWRSTGGAQPRGARTAAASASAANARLLFAVAMARPPERTAANAKAGAPAGPPPPPSAVRRVVSGIPVVPAPEPASRLSCALRAASRHYAEANAKEMVRGEGDQALGMDAAQVAELSVALDDNVAYGVNYNTADKDSRAWEFWEIVCGRMQTSPLRQAQDVAAFPAKTAYLLGALMMYAFAVCEPKDKTRAFIKPSSAQAYPLAITRIFGRWGLHLPGYKAIKAQLAGMSRIYVNYHGPTSLAPKRAEPMKFAMMRKMDAIAAGAAVGALTWTPDNHDIFMFACLNVVMMHTAFRLAEIVGNGSSEIMYLTFASLTWEIRGVLLTDPSPAQLRSMRPGVDRCRLAPPRSKPDQWGYNHCPYPVSFLYHASSTSPAFRLMQLELRCNTHGAARGVTPLFHDDAGSVYTHSFLDRMLRAVLTSLYGAKVATLYTWHSYRVGLATALHAAGVADDMIQLICRWMCPASLFVYRRKGTSEHEGMIGKASAANVDSIQSGSVVRISGDEGFAELFAHGNSAAAEAAHDGAAPPKRRPPAAAGPRRPSPRDPAAAGGTGPRKRAKPEAAQPSP
jgi:hypothetical protein